MVSLLSERVEAPDLLEPVLDHDEPGHRRGRHRLGFDREETPAVKRQIIAATFGTPIDERAHEKGARRSGLKTARGPDLRDPHPALPEPIKPPAVPRPERHYPSLLRDREFGAGAGEGANVDLKGARFKGLVGD